MWMSALVCSRLQRWGFQHSSTWQLLKYTQWQHSQLIWSTLSALCWSTVCVSFRVCVSMCAPVIPNKCSHSWSVAVETRVALLNQHQYEHAHSHGNHVKAGSVRQTGMVNRLDGKTEGYYGIHTQTGLYKLENSTFSGWKTYGLQQVRKM